MQDFERVRLSEPKVLHVEHSPLGYDCEVSAPGKIFKFRTAGPDKPIVFVAIQGANIPDSIPHNVEEAAASALHDYFVKNAI